MNTLVRALVATLTIKFARESLQDTDGYDLFQLYKDLFLTENKRASMMREGIQSVDLPRTRCNAGDKKNTGIDKEKKRNKVYRSKYRISIDHDIPNNHGAFFPKGLSNELVFQLRLTPASDVVKGSDPAKITYEFTNIEPEYEMINNIDLANAVISNYSSGKRFIYEHVNHPETITVNRATDSIIKESRNLASRSILLLCPAFIHNRTFRGSRMLKRGSSP